MRERIDGVHEPKRLRAHRGERGRSNAALMDRWREVSAGHVCGCGCCCYCCWCCWALGRVMSHTSKRSDGRLTTHVGALGGLSKGEAEGKRFACDQQSHRRLWAQAKVSGFSSA